VEPCTNALYAARSGKVFIEAIPLRYDAAAWHKRFLAQWPPGSSAHQSYWDRIVSGPNYQQHEALRLSRYAGGA
jgi:hypothetical protein